MLECSRLDNNLQTCLASLLQIISNSVVNTVDDARSVLQHPVFGEFVMPCANQLQYIVSSSSIIETSRIGHLYFILIGRVPKFTNDRAPAKKIQYLVMFYPGLKSLSIICKFWYPANEDKI